MIFKLTRFYRTSSTIRQTFLCKIYKRVSFLTICHHRHLIWRGKLSNLQEACSRFENVLSDHIPFARLSHICRPVQPPYTRFFTAFPHRFIICKSIYCAFSSLIPAIWSRLSSSLLKFSISIIFISNKNCTFTTSHLHTNTKMRTCDEGICPRSCRFACCSLICRWDDY